MSDGTDTGHGGARGDLRVFVSYRRDDSPDATDRLTAELRSRLGDGNVFLDVDSIEIGARFAKVVDEWVGRCDALLAVIGPDWLEATDDEGNRRLDDPADYVRLEIEAALGREIRVVPVLMHGARIPRRDQLPESLAPLVEYNAIELARRHWDIDVGELVEGLCRITGATPAAQGPPAQAGPGQATPVQATPPVQAPSSGECAQHVALPRPVRRWSRRFALFVGAATVLGTAIAVVLVLALGGNAVTVTSIDVSASESLAIGDGSVWVAAGGSVLQLDASTGKQIGGPIEDLGGPASIAVGQGGVWVGNYNDTVIRIDPATASTLTRPIRVGRSPVAIAVGDHDAWVLNQLSDTVSRIDAASGRVVGAPIKVDIRDPTGIAYGAGAVWVVGLGSNSIVRIDAATGALLPTLSDSLGPAAISFGQGSFWVLQADPPSFTENGSSVSRYRPSGHPDGSPVRVASPSLGIAVGESSVWVTNSAANTVTRINAATGGLDGKPIPVGVTPSQVAAGPNGAWVIINNGTQLSWIRA